MRNSWKKRWKKELDERVPALRDDVLKAPISLAVAPEKQTETVCEEKEKSKKRRLFGGWSFTNALNNGIEKLTAYLKSKKRLILRVTASAVASVMICVLGVSALLPNPETSDVGVYALEINPRVVFTVNDEGVVTTIVAGNADADVILSSEKRKARMEGKPIATAMEYFVDYAAQLGFLDLQTGDIIRLSACDKVVDVSSVRAALTEYFCERGMYVAVLAEEVSAQVFCERVGAISEDTVEQLVRIFHETPTCYAERSALGKTVEELKTIYQSSVSQEEVKSTVEDVLMGILEWIELRETRLQEIADVNDQIKKHSDNPAFLFKDYWSVKKNYQNEETLSIKFTFLMQAMSNLLVAYEKDYNETIESEFDLTALRIEASSEYLHELATLLTDFSMEVFNGSMEFLSTALSLFGVKVDLQSLCKEPQTAEEYVEKTKQYNQIRYNALKKEANQSYREDREVLTKAQYDEFVQSLCAEYGSLQAYWTAMNAD